MQSFEVQRTKELGVKEKNFYEYYSKAFQAVQKTIYPHLENELKNYISARFSLYLTNREHCIYQPKLLHADLSCEHLLFEPKKEELWGIIDFGDFQIGDPDFEYIYLLEECGEAFTVAVMNLLKLK